MHIHTLRSGLLVIVPSIALLAAQACTSADNPEPASGVDAGGDATVPGTDASPHDGALADAANDDSQASNDAAPSDAGANDAALNVDADPWADADTNCADYGNETGTAVTVRIRNDRATPIYIGTTTPDCQYHVGFDLVDSADASLTAALQVNNRCTDFQSNPECPTTSCQPVIVTKIAPDGGTHDIGWPGTVFDARYMAKSCYADAGCATGPCMIERRSPPATVRVTTFPSFYCDGGNCFDCTNGATSCNVFGAVGGTSGAATTTSVPYDGGTGVYVVGVGP